MIPWKIQITSRILCFQILAYPSVGDYRKVALDQFFSHLQFRLYRLLRYHDPSVLVEYFLGKYHHQPVRQLLQHRYICEPLVIAQVNDSVRFIHRYKSHKNPERFIDIILPDVGEYEMQMLPVLVRWRQLFCLFRVLAYVFFVVYPELYLIVFRQRRPFTSVL
jgi:hypothetical protein